MTDEARRRAVDELIVAIAGWASSRDDVRAVALVGSWARGDSRPDSDVDLIVLTTEPGFYLGAGGWARALDVRLEPENEAWGAVTSRRGVAGSGLEVEFGIAPIGWAAGEPLDAGTASVVSGGMRAIYDPDAVLAKLMA